jgi:hypothetical protein
MFKRFSCILAFWAKIAQNANAKNYRKLSGSCSPDFIGMNSFNHNSLAYNDDSAKAESTLKRYVFLAKIEQVLIG